MPLIALLTDFGSADAFVGAMKGVILSIAPQAQLVDITHAVPPQDIRAGALLLEDAYSFFPNGTIFLAVVDPGVGSSRTPLAVQTERFTFVGPDNGLLTLAYNAEVARNPKKCAIRALNNPKFHLPTVSATFHGRDIFAPAAAWLARGMSFSAIGDAHASLVPLDLPQPLESNGALECHSLRVDHFGNVITDLTRAAFALWNPSDQKVSVEVRGASGARMLDGVRQTYADVPAGEAVAYFGSTGRLELACNCANFAAAFGSVSTVVLTKK